MKAMEKNGKKFKGFCTIMQRTGQGVKMAADTGYRTGYFMAKHPNVKMVKDQVQCKQVLGLYYIFRLSISKWIN